MTKKTLIIGVAGGSGSGKTYFASALSKRLGPDKACVISQDNYYKDQSKKFDFDGGSVNFDHPNSLDFDLLAEHLRTLKERNSIHIPKYDFATHSRSEDCIKQNCKDIIIVDGILILGQPQLREIFDLTVFVTAPEDIRYSRRLKRDVEERGRTPEGVKNQFIKQVKPMHDEFVEPSQAHADIISSGTDCDELESNLILILKKYT